MDWTMFTIIMCLGFILAVSVMSCFYAFRVAIRNHRK